MINKIIADSLWKTFKLNLGKLYVISHYKKLNIIKYHIKHFKK
jgi:hypothetical protein